MSRCVNELSLGGAPLVNDLQSSGEEVQELL